jgi:hypothetical protein
MAEIDSSDRLARYIKELFEHFKEMRRANLEEQMRKNYAAYRGQYDSEHLKTWKRGEGMDWRSTAFVKFTQQKIRTYFSQVSPHILQNGKLAFGLGPTPIPESRKGFLDEETAKSAAAKMFLQIQDNFVENRAHRPMRSCILENGVYGWSWLVGPVLKPVTRLVTKYGMEDMKDLALTPEFMRAMGGDSITMEPVTSMLPCLYAPGVWNVFWDLEVADHQEGQGVAVRDMMTVGRFLSLKLRPGYDGKNIDEVAEAYKTDDNATMPDDSAGPIAEKILDGRRSVEAIEFRGRVPKKYLSKYDKNSIRNLASEKEEVEIICTVALGKKPRVIKDPRVNPLPYRWVYQGKCEDLPNEAHGVGEAENVEDVQMILNGLVRAMLDNKALSSNLMSAMNTDRLAAGQKMSVYPGKNWVFNGVDNIGQAIQWFSPPDNTAGMIPMFEMFQQMGDDSTGLSRMMDAQAGPANRTAYELSTITEQGNKLVGSYIVNIDEGLTVPAVRAFYHYHMLTNPDDSLKGDFEPLATGFQSYMDKTRRLQNLQANMNLMLVNKALTALGKWPEMLRESFKLTDLEVNRFLKTDDEIKGEISDLQNQMPALPGGPSPDMTVGPDGAPMPVQPQAPFGNGGEA